MTLRNVADGGKGSEAIRKVTVHLETVDAPGATCDEGENSGPVPISLKMVDDSGHVLIDSAKIAVCNGDAKKVTRDVMLQGPLNCENAAVPTGKFSRGVITAIASAPGTATYVEELSIRCLP